MSENHLTGDFSPEEVRWETYKALYAGNDELNKMVCIVLFINVNAKGWPNQQYGRAILEFENRNGR
jgi:hypothetical protein